MTISPSNVTPLVGSHNPDPVTFLHQHSLLEPSAGEPRNQEGNEPRHSYTDSDTNSELLLTRLDVVLSRSPDHGFLSFANHRETLAHIPRRFITRVEGIGVIDAEGVTLHSVASNLY